MSVESCTTVKCNKLWYVSVDFRMMVVAAMCGNSVFVTSSPASIAIRDVMPLFSASKRGRASEREQEARAARRKKEQEEREESPRMPAPAARARAFVRLCNEVQRPGPGLFDQVHLADTSGNSAACGRWRWPSEISSRRRGPGSSPGPGSGSLCDVCRRCALQKGFRQA